MDYSKLSDFEINKRVAFSLGAKPYLSVEFNKARSGEGVIIKSCFKLGAFDPCNNPADAWPIIVDNQIDIIQDNGQGCALATSSAVMMMQGDDVPLEQDKNPLRAAMIVYLMMQEGSSEK